jgi:hypothetical protein
MQKQQFRQGLQNKSAAAFSLTIGKKASICAAGHVFIWFKALLIV